MIKLEVVIACEGRWCNYVKEAMTLPTGVFWHIGMQVHFKSLECAGVFDEVFTVECVTMCEDGCEISLGVYKIDTEDFEESCNLLVADGWVTKYLGN